MPCVSLPPSLPFSRISSLASTHILSSPFSRNGTEKALPPLTAESLTGLGISSTQLDGWRSNSERHELIALAIEASGSGDEMEKWLDEVERKIGGGGKE